MNIYFKTLRPGKSFPSRYSRKAPPAVDKCVKDNFNSLLFIAAIVSPPPRIDIKELLFVFSEIFQIEDSLGRKFQPPHLQN